MAIRAKNMISEDDPRVAQIGHPAPPWLINYADLMTELVCFFIILYALSAALNKDMQKAQQDIQEMMKEGKISGQVKMDKEGMRITLEEQGAFSFFESGRSEITADMQSKLDKIAVTLKTLSLKHDIIVEGHTDNVPIATKQFASNWELSSARATSVVKYFLGAGFTPKRMAAIGYGEFHPISPNDTEPNRRKNRRVVFFVKTTAYPETAQAPPQKGAPVAVLSEGQPAAEGQPEAGQAPAAEEAPAAEPVPADQGVAEETGR
ncbi:MAG TPA: hypothetical protein DCZ92_02865 [Elusimicrobia bacterium]|nr:hypothetical protein [Elusimicrobiota bacterium]